jgi:hypothetical protein
MNNKDKKTGRNNHNNRNRNRNRNRCNRYVNKLNDNCIYSYYDTNNIFIIGK